LPGFSIKKKHNPMVIRRAGWCGQGSRSDPARR
jgi:hypothetical protein